MADTFTDLPHPQTGDPVPLRWHGSHYMHAVQGADVHPGVRLLWTLCAKRDVPANSAHYGSDEITCPDCLKAIK